MMQLKNLLFLIFIFMSTIALSQSNKDIELKKKLDHYKNINHDSALVIAKELQKSKNEFLVIEAISTEAYSYYRKKNYDKSEEISLNLLNTLNKKIENSNSKNRYYDGKISALNRLFWIKKNQENYQKAYEYLILLDKTNEQKTNKNIKYYRNKVSVKTSKAIIKEALKLESEAKNILLSAYKNINSDIFKNLKNDNYFLQQKANISNSLGNIYMALHRKENNANFIDSASFYYDKAYEVTKYFIPLHKDSDIIYSFRKTEIFIAQKNYNKAIDEIKKYPLISNGFHYHHREYFQKAICYFNLNIADSTIYYANKIINDKKEKCKRSKLITMYDILSKQYDKINKIDSAFKYSQLTLKQYDLARENKEKTFTLLYKNDYEKAQELNAKIKKEEAKKQSSLIVLFAGLLAILSLITFYFLRKQKKQKEELIDQISNQQPIEIDKKEYNIDEALEAKIISKIEEINEKHIFLKSDFSVSYIAESLKTNSTYISFVFNKHYNESFKQHFTKRKIAYIVAELNSNKTLRKYSVQALAEEVGYTNASAFTRAFKKQIGVTPSAYIKTLDE